MNITYEGSKASDNDFIPINQKIKMKIIASEDLKGKKIAIFSINAKGKLLMIEPYRVYSDFENGMTIGGESNSDIGTDFLKVMIFDKENRLSKIKVNEQTGEVLNDSKQIGFILNEVQKNSFYGVVRRVITIDK